jgi:hypothetical protein
MIVFTFLMFVYVFLCMFGFKLYFHLRSRTISKNYSKFKKDILSYLLSTCFIVLEIPFAIFFPAWLGEELMIVERTSESSMYFLLFGCLVLAIALWNSRKYQK